MNSGQTLDSLDRSRLRSTQALDSFGRIENASLDNSGQGATRRRGPHPFGVGAGAREGAYAREDSSRSVDV